MILKQITSIVAEDDSGFRYPVQGETPEVFVYKTHQAGDIVNDTFVPFVIQQYFSFEEFKDAIGRFTKKFSNIFQETKNTNLSGGGYFDRYTKLKLKNPTFLVTQYTHTKSTNINKAVRQAFQAAADWSEFKHEEYTGGML